MKQLFLIFLLGLIPMASFAQIEVPSFRQQAWLGDSVAMVKLSEAFQFGRGVERAEDSALFYMDLAAQKGHPDALYLVGTQLLIKVFSATEYAKGLSFLRKAAEKGHSEAQFRLAQVYSTKGMGNQTDSYYDLKKAYNYADSAASKGHKEALLYCAEARLKGNGTSKNDSIAVVYFQKIADRDYIPAVIRLGDMYWEGKITGKQEPFLAIETFNRVFELGNANVEQKAAADLGIHRIDQFFKNIQNTYLNGNPMMPAGLFEYRLRN